MNTYNNRSNGNRNALFPAAVPVMALEELHHAWMDRQAGNQPGSGKTAGARWLPAAVLVVLTSLVSAPFVIPMIIH